MTLGGVQVSDGAFLALEAFFRPPPSRKVSFLLWSQLSTLLGEGSVATAREGDTTEDSLVRRVLHSPGYPCGSPGGWRILRGGTFSTFLGEGLAGFCLGGLDRQGCRNDCSFPRPSSRDGPPRRPFRASRLGWLAPACTGISGRVPLSFVVRVGTRPDGEEGAPSLRLAACSRRGSRVQEALRTSHRWQVMSFDPQGWGTCRGSPGMGGATDSSCRLSWSAPDAKAALVEGGFRRTDPLALRLWGGGPQDGTGESRPSVRVLVGSWGASQRRWVRAEGLWGPSGGGFHLPLCLEAIGSGRV